MADMKKFAESLKKGPSVSEGVYIAPSADVIGDVILGRDVSVWHNAVIRGDVNDIVIGNRSNVQDCSVLHVNKDKGIIIGENVTIGHSVNLHGCTIGNSVLVGIGAIILDGAVIEDNCVIAAGSLVPPRKTITSGSMVMGSPAKIMCKLTDKDLEWVKENADHYIDYKNVYIAKGM